MQSIRDRLIELMRYGCVSVLAFVVDVGLLGVLVKVGHWHYLTAAATSFVCGGVLAYLLCIRFVFRHRRIENTGLELSSFVALGLVGLVINMSVIYVLMTHTGLSLPLAKLAASAGTFAGGYLLRRTLLFTPPSSESKAK